MSTAVREILDRILHLPQDQRAELDSELSRLEEQEWTALVAEARHTARQRNIDDETIVRAVQSLRYGDGNPKS
jgi:hypothetical protein